MNMKWMEPQSRFVMGKVFKRNFDSFTDEAKRATNWGMLIGDVVGIYALISLL